MFEAAELGHKVPKADYEARVPELRTELLALQQRLRQADFPVIAVVAGVDGAGKGETVNLLNEWMDPRWILTRGFDTPSDEERERPAYWRFWRALPPRGRMGLFVGSWYTDPLLERVYRRIDDDELDRRLERAADFERTLAMEGALILKFWLHLSKAAQKKRFKKLEKDPLLHWKVTEQDWQHWRLYQRFVAAAERIIMRTSAPHAPWHIVEGVDERYRNLTVGETLREALARRLESGPPARQAVPVPRVPETPTILDRLDMSKALTKAQYKVQLKKYQGRLNLLQREARAQGVSTAMVFEGWDASGKGGTIRRIVAAVDVRHCRVVPIAAPTDEERAHHYLWRFWRHLPRAGDMVIFDRSWYGRVLVERVEGFCPEEAWMRAYGEINQFEEQLAERMVLLKFWMHITKDEQLRRFREREAVPYKRWKLTEEDWRNREKWDQYEAAVNDMIERTSTSIAPWTLVEGNDKHYARVKVLKIACERLEAALD